MNHFELKRTQMQKKHLKQLTMELDNIVKIRHVIRGGLIILLLSISCNFKKNNF